MALLVPARCRVAPPLRWADPVRAPPPPPAAAFQAAPAAASCLRRWAGGRPIWRPPRGGAGRRPRLAGARRGPCPPARLQSPGVAAAGEGVCLPSRSALPDAPGQDAAASWPSSASASASRGPAWNRGGNRVLGERGGQGASGPARFWYPLLVKPRARFALLGGLFTRLCEDS